ncbi:aldo-keto reductase family 1 member A1-like [Penaeus japonicus]|uniref:aldo-keto reductase family 1 member A1-like n=1 Tax=Penaeus japonicus TaxID=27405 RepID=UPI001C714200|nr:aldo-keto reductase family 1 member A1-like [Penaeus japonicus]
MPMVGLGTYQGRDDEMRRVLKWALESGYRHIDTAAVYQNEAEIGDVLHEWLSSGCIAREELFVVTKMPAIANRAGDVGRFLQKSLAKLRLSYVDLYLIHIPVGMKANSDDDDRPFDSQGNCLLDFDTDLEGVYKALEEQVDAGKAKAIGLSNFNSKQIERIFKVCRIKPANLQVEVHVYHQQKALREVCRDFGISICAYSPLGAPYTVKGSDEYPILLQHPVVTSLAKRLGRTPAQVLLRFLIQNQMPVIPRSTNQERVKENFQLFDFELSKEDMASLEALDRKGDGRIYDFKEIFKGIEKHPEWTFRIPY